MDELKFGTAEFFEKVFLDLKCASKEDLFISYVKLTLQQNLSDSEKVRVLKNLVLALEKVNM